jgi:hypothetical protein
METREQRNSIPSGPVAILILVLGLTGAWITWSPETAPGSAKLGEASRTSTITPIPVFASLNEPLASTPILRPLALISSALAPEPLFWLPHAGEPRPSNIFEKALSGSSLDAAMACAARVSDFLPDDQKSKDCALIARVQALASARQARVKFVIATLPDWVDSSLQWGFDPILDAVQTLAGQLKYSLAGFDLVDAEPLPQDSQPRGSVWPYPKVHELTPGILLFRKPVVEEQSKTGQGHLDLLAILLIGETATAGANPGALATALDLNIEWEIAARSELPDHGPVSIPIQVLGPTYSGSALPLRIALDEAAKRHAGPWTIAFNIVTGSATDPDNTARIPASNTMRFRSTTRSDPDELRALSRYFGRVNRDWQCGVHVGLLVEANTAWGQDVAGFPSGSSATAKHAVLNSRQSCQLCRDDPDAYYSVADHKAFPCAAVARFPLHISRLRAESQHALAAPGRDLPSRATVSLDLGETEAPTDRVSAETPKITAAAEETMLDGMFDVLGDDRISAIGIFATDKRDHIYLAEEVARHRPNVLPFTVESSLLYLHPDVAGYVQGTLVASTYSLTPRTQQLTEPGLVSPTQFTASNAHGIYNALALLLDKWQYMVDYAPPWFPGNSGDPNPKTRCLSADCAPPVWVSVVGRHGLLPIFVDLAGPQCAPSQAQQDRYIACKPRASIEDVGPSSGRRPFLGTRRFALLACAALIAAMLLMQLRAQRTRMELAAAMTAERNELAAFSWWAIGRSLAHGAFASLRSTHSSGLYTREANCAMAAASVATATLAIYLVKLCAIYFCDWRAISPTTGQLAFFPVAVLGLVYVTSAVYFTFWLDRSKITLIGMGIFFISALLLLLAPGPRVDTPNLAHIAYAAHGLPVRLLALVMILSALAAIFGDRLNASQDLFRWRRVPVLLGLAAFAGFWLDTTLYHWDPTEALLYANRASALSSLVSPVTIVSLTCVSLFWWGMWSLRRIQLLVLPEIEVGIGPLLERSARIAALDPDILFRSPAQPIGTGNLAICGVILSLLTYASHRVGSIDGWPFSAFLLFGATCLFAITLHTLAQCTLLGRGVLSVLQTLGHMPGSETFKKIGESGFPWQISFQEPRFGELEPLLRRVQHIVHLDANSIDEVLRHAALQLRSLLNQLDVAHLHEIGIHPLRRQDWVVLNTIVSNFYVCLVDTLWAFGFDREALPPKVRFALEEKEYVVFFHAAIVLRDLVTRLVSAFTIVFGSLLLLLISHLTYIFQGRVFWLSFDALAIAVAGTFAVRQLFSLERDTIMRNLWRTSPGRISLFRGLTWRMVGYGLVALCTLLVVFFPELLGNLDSWVTSARGVLR